MRARRRRSLACGGIAASGRSRLWHVGQRGDGQGGGAGPPRSGGATRTRRSVARRDQHFPSGRGMSQWPSTKARHVIAALLRLGWRLKRQSGSQRTLSRKGWPNFVFAFHDGEELGPRMLARIARHMGLWPEICCAMSSVWPRSSIERVLQHAVADRLVQTSDLLRMANADRCLPVRKYPVPVVSGQ